MHEVGNSLAGGARRDEVGQVDVFPAVKKPEKFRAGVTGRAQDCGLDQWL